MRKWLWTAHGPLYNQAGEGDGGGGISDAVKALIGTEVNTAVNGAMKRIEKQHEKQQVDLTGRLDKLTGAVEGLVRERETPPPGEKKEGEEKSETKLDPAVNAELMKLRKIVEQQAKAQEEATKKTEAAEQKAAQRELDLAVQEAIGNVNFANESSRELVKEHLKRAAKRDENGVIVVESSKGEVPLKDYAASYIDQSPNLIAAPPAGGAGTGKGTPAKSGRFDLDRIKPGMSPEENKEAFAEIAKFL